MEFEIIIRIFLATVIAGIIGYEREHENKPAGIRTHILVCVGATTIAVIERLLILEISYDGGDTFLPTISVGRLTAQVISGIGFLGAGTIIINRQKILGLTTAASIWATAALGIAVGYGFYTLVIISFIIIIITLTLLKRVLQVNSQKKLKIMYTNRVETMDFIMNHFQALNITIKDIDFNVEITETKNIYTNVYTLDIKKGVKLAELLDYFSRHPNITRVRSGPM